jgi:O-antigen/teichoic acid export membrane protein
MKERISYLLNKDEGLLKHGGLIFLSMTIVNVLSYLFQLYVGRALGPVGYAAFAALNAFIYILVIPISTITTAMTNFVSEFNAKKQMGRIRMLFEDASKKLFLASLGCFVVFMAANQLIADFLRIEPTGLIILSFGFFFTFLFGVSVGVLGGLQKFKVLGGLNVLLGALKLAFGVVLVSLGFAVAGAIGAIVLSGAVVFFLSLFWIKPLFKHRKQEINKKRIYRYMFPVFLSLLCFTLLTNLDIILVKHLFPSDTAGYYSAASIIGKIVFYFSSSISLVLFPKVTDLYTRNRETKRILRNSLAYVFLLSIAIVAGFWLFPDTVVTMLFGNQYPGAIPLIGMFGIALMLFSLINILLTFNMAIKRMTFLAPLVAFTVLEAALIYAFHASLMQVVNIVTLSLFTLFIVWVIIDRKYIV